MRSKLLAGAVLAGLCMVLVGCDRNDPMDPVDDTGVTPDAPAAGAAPPTPPPAAPDAGMPTGVEGSTTPGTSAGNVLTARFGAVAGATVTGEAEFSTRDDGVHVVAVVRGASPGPKGIHVHENGDCSDPVGGSMGSHFAPDGNPHALPSEPPPRHLGDLGNLDVDEMGNGRLEITVTGASLAADDANSFRNRALILHAGEDKGSANQPAGDSGDPVACAVIS